ncbi:MAG TPA: metal-dependent hydrolase [Acidobacteriaceae bacterium]
MEPVTHLMTGACLARLGFNRKAAYATLAMTLAAEAPDLDTLWSIHGPVAAFQHHRGFTHTLLGLPFDGLVVLGIVWVVHRWRMRRAAGSAGARPLTAAPLRWGLLYGFAMIGTLSHLLLDWTNNYGVRPFFPFNPRWYAGSFVFIFEPVMFVLLMVALLAPLLFGLIGSEVGARRAVFRGRGWAAFALAAIAVLWSWRWIERDSAVRLASTASYGPAGSTGAEVLRVTASPYPGNPYRWHTVAELPGFYQMATVDTLSETVATNPEQDLFYMPAETAATQAAKQSWLGRAYLDWSSWPLVTEMGPEASDDSAQPPTAVRFVDLRFLYDSALIEGRNHPPLSGTVDVDAGGHVVGMKLGSRTQW